MVELAKNKQWHCHHCTGYCQCTRCLRADHCSQAKAYLISIGGDFEELKESKSLFDQLIYRSFNEQLELTLGLNQQLYEKYPRYIAQVQGISPEVMQRVCESVEQEEPNCGHFEDDIRAAGSLFRYALTAAKADNDEFISEQPVSDSHFLNELLEGIKQHEPSRVTIIHKKRGRKRFTTVDDDELRGLLTRKEQR